MISPRTAGASAEMACTAAEARILGVFNQGVHPYLRETPSGYRSYSAQGHAASESTLVRTNQKFREQRVFAVPHSIDPDGRTYMEAHFKLGAKRSISPRLYYLDATQIVGNIYVGYLGHISPTRKRTDTRPTRPASRILGDLVLPVTGSQLVRFFAGRRSTPP